MPKRLKKKRMLIVNLGKEDREAIQRIMAKHGHEVRTGAVRLAIRTISGMVPDKHTQPICVRVRQEGLRGTPEHARYFKDVDRMPIAFRPDDETLLAAIAKAWNLDDESKAIRLALRITDAIEA